ncbi:Serine palmitoyltransferase 2 [Trichoplax sp. H2]|uniref:serine C-palmitoyltransferase n=1 Tax=Trichoplax adhaerens TaxID=10228 RepID=B3S6J9_TRIAD|nr:hypothetical protein TRIADDRAFT_30228 [Trichoplax adhaerens]EDV21631.1 hypothetical protein TRIADDRAFT_30228 [Trichoplax adhaerens]RDD47452.1 Serine palmitoyltransferase 2 [Trichoplax sp. H2]|eukprot:XP_002115779.1 hypothetical protein TRIADDRAFT_30228 [Trichoplax adhaerens]
MTASATLATKRVTRSSYKKRYNNSEENDEHLDNQNGNTGKIDEISNDEEEFDYSYEAQEEFEEPPLHVSISTYVSYTLLIMLAYLKDILVRYGILTFGSNLRRSKMEDFVPLYSNFEALFTRFIYMRIRDCWNRPIASVPGAEFDVLERYSTDNNWTFQYTGRTKRCLNLSSYNYLGFAEKSGPCTDAVETAIEKYGLSTCASRLDFGILDVHKQLEERMAEFVGKEAALAFGMGFAVNSTCIPALVGKGCMIISDELNHASIVTGARLSGAKVSVYRHNDMENLEKILRQAVISGQPRTHRPWKKLLIIVEGIYSMEGSIIKLPEVIRLKKKYGAYLFIDEAHSIGALGRTGRGVCEHCSVDPNDVDILMGTFTKSFGACGGYIASSKDVIDHLRANSHSSAYSATMSAPIARQTLSALSIIMNKDGTSDGKNRLRRLAWNCRYFRKRLREMGFMVFGNNSSPVVPLLLFMPGKIAELSRRCLQENLAVVVVGYPATPLNSGRVRFCLSAAHTKEMLDDALEKISNIGDLLQLKYNK